jgi:hypothetical protein
MKIFRTLMFALVAVALFVPAVQAQEAGQRVFEIYSGLYVPGIDDLDNDLTFGLRFGGRPSENWGYNVSLGYLDLQQNNTRPLDEYINSADGYFVDFSGIWYIAGSDFGLFGGLGWGTVNVGLAGTTEDISDDALTYNYGLNYVWNFGEKYMLKPQVLWRKWDGDTYEKTDEEYTVSFGWRF